MDVLVLALRRWIIKTKFAYLFYLAKWLSHSFDRMIYFYIVFFLIILENSALCTWKFSSPMANSYMESSPTYPPLLNPSPPNQQIPLKTSVHFPLTITICKHWSKFVTCSPSHGDCGGVSRPQKHSYKVFRLCWIKWLLDQNFDPVTLGK